MEEHVQTFENCLSILYAPRKLELRYGMKRNFSPGVGRIKTQMETEPVLAALAASSLTTVPPIPDHHPLNNYEYET